MDQFGLPEQHDVLLVLDSLLNLGSEEVSSLLLLNLVNFTESSISDSFNDLVALI